MASSNLFKPISVGQVNLQHRIVMAPLTRFRCNDSNVPLPNMKEYYTQRASEPGTLMITEAVSISPRHCPLEHAPGIWSQAQKDAWRSITDAVQKKGCFMICQLVAPGRAGALPGYPLCSSSPVAMEVGAPTPQEMTESDIQDCIADFVQAGRNALDAGFDGIELHGANGYLIDEFTQSTCNKRTDSWGGSVQGRSKFVLDLAEAVVRAVGAKHVGIRFSPWSTFQGMKMEVADEIEQFSHIVQNLRLLNLAYLHFIESRVNNNIDCEKVEGLEFALDIWNNHSPVLVAGGFDDEKARTAVDGEYSDYDGLVVFGRYFVSTPDLVFRVRRGIPPQSL